MCLSMPVLDSSDHLYRQETRPSKMKIKAGLVRFVINNYEIVVHNLNCFHTGTKKLSPIQLMYNQSTYFNPRCSLSVFPSYCFLKISLFCISGTTNSMKSSKLSGSVGGMRLNPSATPLSSHISI